MDRGRFLSQEHDRIIASGEFVVEHWRSSKDRFIRDLWDRTPIATNQRRLEPIDPSLGFSPDNVEWHFRRVRKRGKAGRKTVAAAHASQIQPTRAERKAAEAATKEAKRQALAEEFQRWERERSAKGASK